MTVLANHDGCEKVMFEAGIVLALAGAFAAAQASVVGCNQKYWLVGAVAAVPLSSILIGIGLS